MSLTVRRLTGGELSAALDDLAALRIAVFADWPYLYDGDAAYEADYLREFAAAPDAAGQTYVLPAGAFLAIDDGRISRLTMYYNLADWTAQVA